MIQFMQINGANVPIIDFGGIRVVTMKQIADLHQVKINNIIQNFRNNRKHFIEGTDFYEYAECPDFDKLTRANLNMPGENISHGIPQKSNATSFQTRIFFTETGYLMLVKSLTDDLAWEVQRLLVTNYFRQSVVNDLWIILPKVTRWVSKLVRRPWSDNQIIYYVMANYKMLEHDIKIAKRKSVGKIPVAMLEDDNG